MVIHIHLRHSSIIPYQLNRDLEASGGRRGRMRRFFMSYFSWDDFRFMVAFVGFFDGVDGFGLFFAQICGYYE
jgi:hypothetical protein